MLLGSSCVPTELPEFKEYQNNVIEKNITGYFNNTDKEKAFHLMDFLKEFFTSVE